MKSKLQHLVQAAKKIRQSLIEVVKVLSSMAVMFLVLIAIGPLTHAAQHIERLF